MKALSEASILRLQKYKCQWWEVSQRIIPYSEVLPVGEAYLSDNSSYPKIHSDVPQWLAKGQMWTL